MVTAGPNGLNKLKRTTKMSKRKVIATRAERSNFDVADPAANVPMGELLMLAERQRDELTIGEAGALLGFCRKTVSNLVSEGKLKRIRHGRVTRKSVMIYRMRKEESYNE